MHSKIETDTDLESENVRTVKGRTGFGHRAPWNSAEKRLLQKAFKQGATINALSKTHQRTANAILIQLCKLRCITQAQRLEIQVTMNYDWSVPDANTYVAAEEIDFNF